MLRLPRIAAAGLMAVALPAILSVVAHAQTTPNAVYETSRAERTVQLVMRSGTPHPYQGDYPVTVFLPPGYATSSAKYPVIYFFDGYDFHEAHDTLVAENLIQPAILVAISNKTSVSRSYDLTPYEYLPYGAPTGGLETFHGLITRELKAYLDSHFRTRPEPASTGVMGNSFGGLAACYLGYVHPETYGLVASTEPSLWWNYNQLLNRLQNDASPKTQTRFWIMSADQESTMMWQNAKYGAYCLTRRGWIEGTDIAFHQVHNYPHGSAAVRTQLRDMFHFLLRLHPPEPRRIELTNCHGPQLVPLRPAERGGVVNAYLDVHYREGIRTTAIFPTLTVADARVASVVEAIYGTIVALGPGWTTVSTDFAGFHAVIDVQGQVPGSASEPPVRSGPPRLTAHPESLTVAASGDATFRVSADGDGPLTYAWRHDGELIAGATTASLTLPSVTAAALGDYSVIVSHAAGGSTLSRDATLLVATPDPGRVTNLSVLATAGINAQPLMVGFVVRGGSKQLLLRAVGPTLAASFGVSGVLPDPRLDVYEATGSGARLVASNDSWATGATSASFGAVGAFPLSSPLDAALALAATGARTVHVSGSTAASSGTVLVECYDADAVMTSALNNVSVRHRLDAGGVLTAGFVISGNVPRRLLIRGLGPALATKYGIAGCVPDPVLALHSAASGRDTIVATNDNWSDEPGAAASATTAGAFELPAGSKDAVLMIVAPAGAYTVQLTDAAAQPGEGLIEIYVL